MGEVAFTKLLYNVKSAPGGGALLQLSLHRAPSRFEDELHERDDRSAGSHPGEAGSKPGLRHHPESLWRARRLFPGLSQTFGPANLPSFKFAHPPADQSLSVKCQHSCEG
ncbi:unnamed protein product [Symbiodinium sp. CCMP2456]|nr:unnamed protein product [Symbiodinium sp. CCMP2456]